MEDVKVSVVSKEFALVDRTYIAGLVKSAIQDSTHRALVNFDETAFPEEMAVELGRELGQPAAAPAVVTITGRPIDEFDTREQLRLVADVLGADFTKDLLTRFGKSGTLATVPPRHLDDLWSAANFARKAFEAGRNSR